MPDETQATQQAAETQPETQPQPAAQPEAGAQVAPEPQADGVPSEPKGELALVTHSNGTSMLMDEEGNYFPVPEEPAAGEPAAPAAQPAAQPEEPAADDWETKAKGLQERIDRTSYLGREPAMPYVPDPQQAAEPPEFDGIDESTMPNFKDSKFANDEDAAAAMRDWALKAAQEAAVAHAGKIVEADRKATAEHAEAVRRQIAQDSEIQHERRIIAKAQARSGLSEEEFATRYNMVRQNSIPAWYHQGINPGSLPVQYARKIIDVTAQARAAADLPMDSYETPVDFDVETTADPQLARAITDAFPRTPESLVVLHTIAEGERPVSRLKALTTTDEGKKVLADLLSRPVAPLRNNRMAFDHYVRHVWSAIARFDQPAEPARNAGAQPAAATNTPPAAPVRRPTRTPPTIPVTPTLEGGQSGAGSRRVAQPGEPGYDPDVYEASILQEIEDYRKQHGHDPAVLT